MDEGKAPRWSGSQIGKCIGRKVIERVLKIEHIIDDVIMSKKKKRERKTKETITTSLHQKNCIDDDVIDSS